MSYWAIFTTAFIVGLSGAVMPGPVLALTISETTKRGFVAGPLIILGHAVLEGILVVGLVCGLGSVLERGTVMGPVALLGAVVLVWMGFQMLCQTIKHRANLDLSLAAPTTGVRTPIFKGLLLSLANPYWIVWWATVGLTFIGASGKRGVAGILWFFSGHILADFAWYSVVSGAITVGGRSVVKRVYPWLYVMCGCFLVGIAVYFFRYGVNRLSGG
jgi:threonine/homoserine/homoserine lactone efflux protein